MSPNDVIKCHLDNADKMIDAVANRLNSEEPVYPRGELGELVNSLNEVIGGLRKLNDQMRPLASLSALLISAEKLQAFARQAAAAQDEPLKSDITLPPWERRFQPETDLPKIGED